MPVVMNRAQTGQPKGASAAKPGKKPADKEDPGMRLKIAILCAVIIFALAIVGWSTGQFSSVTPPNPTASEKSASADGPDSAAPAKNLTAGGGALQGKRNKGGDDAD